MAYLNDEALDGGLDWVVANGVHLHLCTSDPGSVYTNASTGVIDVDVGDIDITGDTSIGNGATDGRSVTVAQQTITPGANGTVSHWALTDNSSVVVASGAFSSSFAVTSGVDVTIAAFAAATHRDPA